MGENKKIKNTRKKIVFWKNLSCLSFFIFSLVLIFSSILVYNHFFNNSLKSSEGKTALNTEKKKEKCPDCLPRLLDGKLVKSGQENLYPLAIIIDNHTEARPSFGLSQASLVYETEAEGQITRFLAFFDSGEKIKKIGPVRSARPYFLDWARGLSALLVHCGGSPSALARLAQNDLINLNEFYYSNYFWRSSNKKSPHNIFTSSTKINQYLKNRGLEERKILPWKFKEKNSGKAPKVKHKKININFHNQDYNVSWKYRENSGSYLRFLGEKKHLDGGKKEIRAHNLIIQYTDFEILDEKLRLNIKTLGRGEAIICQDGICRKGFWKKDSPRTRTRYYYKNGEEVKFNSGTTWIEVMRNSYKNDNIFTTN